MIEFEKTDKGAHPYEKDQIENENIPLTGHEDECSFEVIESPGRYLRAKREIRNLSLEEAAKSTKIREHFLRAIEEDRYELLPHAIYVRGFLTHYAKYLGLDPTEVVLHYQKYHKGVPTGPPEMQKEIRPLPRRMKPRLHYFYYISIFAIVLLVSLIPLLIYYTIYQSKEGFPPVLKKQESPSLFEVPVPPSLPIQNGIAAQGQEIEQKEERRAENGPTPDFPSFEVVEASIGTAIEWEGPRAVLRGIRREFTSDNQRPYFFTRIKTEKEGKITHVWLWEGKEFHRKEVEVRPPAWSVYTYITLSPRLLGEWKAEVRDGDNVLATLNFRVKESAR